MDQLKKDQLADLGGAIAAGAANEVLPYQRSTEPQKFASADNAAPSAGGALSLPSSSTIGGAIAGSVPNVPSNSAPGSTVINDTDIVVGQTAAAASSEQTISSNAPSGSLPNAQPGSVFTTSTAPITAPAGMDVVNGKIADARAQFHQEFGQSAAEMGKGTVTGAIENAQNIGSLNAAITGQPASPQSQAGQMPSVSSGAQIQQQHDVGSRAYPNPPLPGSPANVGEVKSGQQPQPLPMPMDMLKKDQLADLGASIAAGATNEVLPYQRSTEPQQFASAGTDATTASQGRSANESPAGAAPSVPGSTRVSSDGATTLASQVTQSGGSYVASSGTSSGAAPVSGQTPASSTFQSARLDAPKTQGAPQGADIVNGKIVEANEKFKNGVANEGAKMAREGVQNAAENPRGMSMLQQALNGQSISTPPQQAAGQPQRSETDSAPGQVNQQHNAQQQFVQPHAQQQQPQQPAQSQSNQPMNLIRDAQLGQLGDNIARNAVPEVKPADRSEIVSISGAASANPGVPTPGSGSMLSQAMNLGRPLEQPAAADPSGSAGSANAGTPASATSAGTTQTGSVSNESTVAANDAWTRATNASANVDSKPVSDAGTPVNNAANNADTVNNHIRENYAQFEQNVINQSQQAAADQVKHAVEGANSVARNSLEGTVTGAASPLTTSHTPSSSPSHTVDGSTKLHSGGESMLSSAPQTSGQPSVPQGAPQFGPVDGATPTTSGQPGSSTPQQGTSHQLLAKDNLLKGLADVVGSAPDIKQAGSGPSAANPGPTGDAGNSMLGRVLFGALPAASGKTDKTAGTQKDNQNKKSEKGQSGKHKRPPTAGEAAYNQLKEEEEKFLQSGEEQGRQAVKDASDQAANPGQSKKKPEDENNK